MRAASPKDIWELVSGGVSLRVTSFTGAVTSREELRVTAGFEAAFAEALGAGMVGAGGRSNLASVTDTRELSATLSAASGLS